MPEWNLCVYLRQEADRKLWLGKPNGNDLHLLRDHHRQKISEDLRQALDRVLEFEALLLMILQQQRNRIFSHLCQASDRKLELPLEALLWMFLQQQGNRIVLHLPQASGRVLELLLDALLVMFLQQQIYRQKHQKVSTITFSIILHRFFNIIIRSY